MEGSEGHSDSVSEGDTAIAETDMTESNKELYPKKGERLHSPHPNATRVSLSSLRPTSRISHQLAESKKSTTYRCLAPTFQSMITVDWLLQI